MSQQQPETDPKSTPLPPVTPSEPAAAAESSTTNPSKGKSRLSIAGLTRSASKAWSSQEAQSGRKMLGAVGKTVVGAHPIWLMGEALTGRKVGSQFKKGSGEVVVAAEELRGILTDSAKDVLVIVDQKMKTQKEEATKTADVLRSAGADAIVVVTSSLLESKSQFQKNAPGLKHTVLKNSKDVVVILDKACKQPIVVTGVTKYAKAHGIPRAEAIMTVTALCVGKLVKILEQAEAEAKEELDRLEAEAKKEAAEAEGAASTSAGKAPATDDIVVIDVDAFERTNSKEENKEAEKLGKLVSETPGNVPGGLPEASTSTDKGKGKKKDDGCIIM
ncbi:hypothetical protein CPB86DRAFT_828172 [Serendipita vermifera]|nr:hypothetical protein CPB86DRAFT_828172 [Serendipita vermifera]